MQHLQAEHWNEVLPWFLPNGEEAFTRDDENMRSVASNVDLICASILEKGLDDDIRGVPVVREDETRGAGCYKLSTFGHTAEAYT